MRSFALLKALALATNLVLVTAALVVQLDPRYPEDRWAAGSLMAVGLLNGAALLPRQPDPEAEHRRHRLRRIALIVNGVLMAVAAALVLTSFGGSMTEALAGLVVLVPPSVTTVALVWGQPAGGRAGKHVLGPSLCTPRLRLAPFAAEDAGDLHALFNDPEVRRYLWDDRPVSREEVAEQIRLSTESFAARGFGHFALRSSEAPGRLLGFAGLRPAPEMQSVEILYALRPDQWGRGLATEGALEVLRFGFESAALPEIVAGADAPNSASFRVMERLGMAYQRDVEIRGRPTRYYRIRRDDFTPAVARRVG